MTRFIISGMICLVFAVSGSTAAERLLSGVILDEQGDPIENVSVHLDQREVQTESGAFQTLAGKSTVYRLAISANGFYPVMHSFADGELARDKDGYRIPPIVLVRKKPGRVMMAFGGDAMMGRRFKDPERGEPRLIRPGSEEQDTADILRRIAPYMSVADFASVNMETPLMDRKPKTAAPKSYVFYSPTSMLRAFEATGIDFVSLGNNHVNDFVEEGAASTMRALKKSGIGYSGGGMNEKNALAAWRQEINGISTSHLGFVGWKGRVVPNQVADGPAKSGAAYGSEKNIRQTVAREDEASDLVVFQYHGSREYSYGPSKSTEGRMKMAIDQGADLVIGHHPHVVHGFELYQDKLIAYSLGNFLFDQYRYETHQSAMLYVWMDGDRFHRAEVVPLYIKNYRPTPAVGDIREYVLRRLADQSAGRGVVLSRSGGHAVVTPKQKSLPEVVGIQVSGGVKYRRLNVPWYFYPRAVEGFSGNYRFGRDRLLFGDFEQEGLWGLSDSNWSYPDQSCAVQSRVVYNGYHALCLPAGKATSLRNFIRTHDFEPGTPLTLHGFIRAEQAALLKVALSYWEQGSGRVTALKKGPTVKLGEVTAEAGEWREFAIDFPAPDKKKIKGFRLVLENENGSGTPVFLDDLSLIEWQKYRNSEKEGETENPLFRMNFMEFNALSAEPAAINIRGYVAPVATGKDVYTQSMFKIKGISKDGN